MTGFWPGLGLDMISSAGLIKIDNLLSLNLVLIIIIIIIIIYCYYV